MTNVCMLFLKFVEIIKNKTKYKSARYFTVEGGVIDTTPETCLGNKKKLIQSLGFHFIVLVARMS